MKYAMFIVIDPEVEVTGHVLTEAATHAGHVDIVRELIDGRQFLVMP